MKYPEKMLLKLPEGTLARLDAISGNRSKFVRDLVLGAVSGGGKPEPVVREGTPKPVRKPFGEKPEKSIVQKPQTAPRVSVGKKKNSTVPVEEVEARLGKLRPDARDLYAVVRGGSVSPRVAATELGWMQMRVDRAERELVNAGLVSYQSGLMVTT